jgi:hypothetical protein
MASPGDKRAFAKRIIFMSMWLLPAFSALGQPLLWNIEQTNRETPPGFVILAQGLRPLRPKPGFIIGRVLDRQGRPVTNVQLYVAGSVFGRGDPLEEIGGLVAPNIDPRTGYFELKVPDGIYRVSARFDERTTAQLGSRIDCLLLDHFKSIDGESPNALYHSKNGIVKDFIWMSSAEDISKCMR